MLFYNKTVLEFFDSSQKTYIIPVYQRAYSWERDEWLTFLNDILEQIEGKNNYFFGNILLETINKGTKYEIIDGQQRVTTLAIFIRSILNVLKKRNAEPELEDFDFLNKESIFLKNKGNIKLRPVDYDRACYDAIIIDNNDNFETHSLSQARIKLAKDFFVTELKKLSTDKVISILDKIERTELTVMELDGKKDSALMFELENNRGKDLTNMEKLKSYFMYQMYVYSLPEEIDSNIEYISNVFKSIYLLINELKLNEDSVLIYHNNAYINGYKYRTISDVQHFFKQSDNKVDWIKAYITELHTSFSNLKKFEKTELYYAGKLRKIKIPAFIYPFIIKGYKAFGNNDQKMNTLFHLLEILTFRNRLINSRANIQERLDYILLNFNNDLLQLITDIKNKLNESWYWGDVQTRHYLSGSIYGNKILNYLLWEYENSIQNKGYNIREFSLEDEQIEHISPQKPTNGEPIYSGYDVDENSEYSEEFTTTHLNALGNLMLISGTHNKSIGNKPFEHKLASYNSNPLLNQQAEIREFAETVDNKFYWKSSSIQKRHEQIFNFAVKRWHFESIATRHLIPTLEEYLNS